MLSGPHCWKLALHLLGLIDLNASASAFEQITIDITTTDGGETVC